MLEKIFKTLSNSEDPNFYLYQFPTYLFSEYGEVTHTVVSSFAKDGYMGLRQAWKLVDPEDIRDKLVAEIGCNVGATSYEILKMNPEYLFSYDISSTAIDCCDILKNHHEYINWKPFCREFTCNHYDVDTVIWEDPHTATNDEWKEIIEEIYLSECKTIYFLECDNIQHLIKTEAMIQLSENSWKHVL